MLRVVKIPNDRIAAIIGKDGKTKKGIEEATNTEIKINDGDIIIEGETIDVMIAENIVRAIGRGFSPEKAKLLLDENNVLVVINISDNEKELKRIKARLIGTGGKSRRNIERLSHTDLSVYGKTVSIIGKNDDVKTVCPVLEKLIKGTSHRFVYQYLEKVFSKRNQI